jgi:ketosteroid isomerase-like protein
MPGAMSKSRFGLIAAFALLLGPLAACGSDEPAKTAIRNALMRWTADFNDGNADKVCNLFAPDLRSNFHGQPESNFETLCAQLQKSLKDEARSYHYGLDIEEIVVAGDVAIVRLVWTLSIQPKGGGSAIVSRERGLDVFRKQPNGTWKIVRFLAYNED